MWSVLNRVGCARGCPRTVRPVFGIICGMAVAIVSVPVGIIRWGRLVWLVRVTVWSVVRLRIVQYAR